MHKKSRKNGLLPNFPRNTPQGLWSFFLSKKTKKLACFLVFCWTLPFIMIITFGMKSILDIIIAVAAAPSLPFSSTLIIIIIIIIIIIMLLIIIMLIIMVLMLAMIMILVVQKPEHSLVKHLINLKVLLGDTRVVPSCRQAQLEQVQQQLGLVSHLVHGYQLSQYKKQWTICEMHTLPSSSNKSANMRNWVGRSLNEDDAHLKLWQKPLLAKSSPQTLAVATSLALAPDLPPHRSKP